MVQLSMLLVSGALARPDRRFVAAFANALGTVGPFASFIIPVKLMLSVIFIDIWNCLLNYNREKL